MKSPEHNLQVAIIQYLRFNHVFCFAIPNGGRRDAATGAMLKKEGVLAGVADLEIIMPNRVIFVELKNGKAGRQSGEQKWFEREVKCRGIEYYVWRSMDDCVSFVNSDMALRKDQIPERGDAQHTARDDSFNKCGNGITTGADVSAFTSTPPTLNAE